MQKTEKEREREREREKKRETGSAIINLLDSVSNSYLPVSDEDG